MEERMTPSMKGTGSRSNYALTVTAILVLGSTNISLASDGMVRISTGNREAQQVSLVVGKSTVLDVPVPIKRASLADPQIADAIVLSPKQIYVTGKGYGTTNLTLWGKDDQVLAIFDLDVGVDLVRLKQHLAELLPDETNIHLRGTHDHVSISGTVSSEGRLNQVMQVAEAYAPKKVLNFLKVYPEPVGNPAPDVQTVTVEVIKGISVGSVKF
jgi:pilus assembly protein CpaC